MPNGDKDEKKDRSQRIDDADRLANIRLRNSLRNIKISPDKIGIPQGASLVEENRMLRRVLYARGPTAKSTSLPPVTPPPPPTPRQSRGGVRTPMGRIPAPVVGAGRQFLKEAVRGGLNVLGMANVAQPIMAERGKTLTEATRERLPEPIRWRPPEKPGEGTGAFLADVATAGMSYLPTEAERREDPVGSLIKSGTVAGGFVLGPAAKGAYKVARPMLAPVVRAARPTLAPVTRPLARLPGTTKRAVQRATERVTERVTPAQLARTTFAELPEAGGAVVNVDEVIRWQGRDIVNVRLPDGKFQPFYKRTGTGGPAKFTGKGQWAPFDGLTEDAPMGLPKGWFNKAAYAMGPEDEALFRLGTEQNRGISNALKQIEESLPKPKEASSIEDVNKWLGVPKRFIEQGPGKSNPPKGSLRRRIGEEAKPEIRSEIPRLSPDDIARPEARMRGSIIEPTRRRVGEVASALPPLVRPLARRVGDIGAARRRVGEAVEPIAQRAKDVGNWITRPRRRGINPEEIDLMIGEPLQKAGTPAVFRKMTNKVADVLEQTAFHRNNLRKIGELFEKRFGVGAGVRLMDPGVAATRNPGAKAKVLYWLMEADQTAERNMHRLRLQNLYSPKRGERIFNIDEKGLIDVGKGVKVAWGDVFENPGKYPELFAGERKKFLQQSLELIDGAISNYEEVSGKTIRKQLSRENYWPRFVEGRVSFKKAKGTLGNDASSFKQRIHETMEEGIEKGTSYINNPVEVIDLYVKSIQKATRDEILKKRLIKSKVIRKFYKNQPIEEGYKELNERTFISKSGNELPWMAKREYQKEIDQIIEQPKDFLKAVDRAGGISRFLATGTMDMGQFFYQLANLFFYSPERWARTMATGYKALILDPMTLARDAARNPEPYRLYARYGGNVGELSEMVREARIFEELGKKSLPRMDKPLREVPVVGQALRGAGAYATRFSAAFNASLIKGKVEMFEGMYHAAKGNLEKNGARLADGRIARVGQEGYEEALEAELRRVRRSVDTMLGTTDPKTLGVSANQQSLESGFLFFSPRYTRSVFGTAANMFGNGASNKEVQKVMLKMLAGGATIMAASTYLHTRNTGKDFETELYDEVLNPRNKKKFMSLPIGGTWVGVGGAYRSAMQLFATLTAIESLGLAKEGESAWDFDKTGAGGMWKQRLFDNPITKYVRSRSAPVGGTLMDAIDGEDFLGRPFPAMSVEDSPRLAEYLLGRVAPFPAQAFLENFGAPDPEETPTSIKVRDALAAFGAEAFLGARTSAVRHWDLADDLSKETFKGRSYGDLERWEKDIINKDPRIQRMSNEAESFGFWKEKGELETKRSNQMNDLIQEASQQWIPGVGESYSSKFKSYIRQKYQDIQETHHNQLDLIEDQYDIEYPDPENVNKQDLADWYAVWGNLEPGQSYDEGINNLKYRILTQENGSERWEYVLRNTHIDDIPYPIFRTLSKGSQSRRRESQAARERYQARQ